MISISKSIIEKEEINAVCGKMAHEVLSLPEHPSLSFSDLEFIIDKICKYAK